MTHFLVGMTMLTGITLCVVVVMSTMRSASRYDDESERLARMLFPEDD